MLQKYLPVLFVLGCMLTGSAQIKIGDNPQNIHPASVLELESNSRALVITRVNTQEMNAIVPLQGAMVYNNDTQCIHFYDGNGWLNLCDALGLSFSTDPVVNPAETIVITETDGNRNFEVGQITGMNIVDFSIGGADLQNNSITANKLAANSVGSEELQDNTVTDDEIDYNVVTLNDFFNDAGYITQAEVISNDPDNDIIDNGGVFYDDATLQSDIAANAATISNHLVNDKDQSTTNELISSIQLSGDELIINEGFGNVKSVDLSDLNNAGTDSQNLTNPTFNSSSNILTLGIQGGNNVTADLSPLANTDNQTLNISGNILTITGGNSVPIPTSDGSDTEINPGPGIDVSGTGAGGDPYIISNTFTEVDGSIINELQNLNEVLADGNDAGGQAILNIIDNPSPTSVVTKAYVDAQVGGGGSTELADQLTIIGDGTLGNEFEVADGGITTDKIAPGAADQILRTDPTGTSVTWVNLPAGGNQDLSQVLTQGNDAGAQQISNLLDPSLDQDAATKKYVDDAVVAAGGGVPTDELITNFQLVNPNLLQITEDAVDWDVDLDAVFATDAELAALNVDDADNDPNNEFQNLSQVLTLGPDAGGLLINNLGTPLISSDAATKGYVDNQVSILGPTVSADTPNSITTGTDGGALYNDLDDDPANELQAITSTDATVAITQTGNDYDLSVPGSTDNQNLTGATLTGTDLLIEIEDGTSVTADLSAFPVDDADADPANELQAITSTDATVAITQTGNDYDLSVPGSTDNQNLTGAALTGTDLLIEIEDGTSVTADLSAFPVDDADADPANELQAITSTDATVAITQTGNDYDLSVPGSTDNQNLTGATLTGTDLLIEIEDGTSVTADLSAFPVDDADADPANELQAITSTDATVAITQTGNDYDLSVPGSTDNQNLTGATLTGTNLLIEIEDGTSVTADLSAFPVDDADADPNNEIELPSGGNNGDVLSTDGTAVSWQAPSFVSPVKAWGKFLGDFLLRTQGISSAPGSDGSYTVNLSVNRGNSDYTVLLSVEGDNRIYLTNQANNTFSVEIRSNSTDQLVSATWYATVIDN